MKTKTMMEIRSERDRLLARDTAHMTRSQLQELAMEQRDLIAAMEAALLLQQEVAQYHALLLDSARNWTRHANQEIAR